MRRHLVLAAAAVALAAPAAAHGQASSSFTQLTGNDACVAQPLPAGAFGESPSACAKGHGLGLAEGVAVSPDQANVYVAAAGTPRTGSNAIVTFQRDATSGALKQIGCTSDDGGDGRTGSDGLCEDGDALSGANDVAVSPDGLSVYVSTSSSHGLAWFTRDPDTGELEQSGCFKAIPRRDHCTGVGGLLGADGVTVSPDGLNVYVVSAQDDAVVTFKRDPETGALTPGGCVSNTGSDGACADGTALQGASSVAVSPDGAFVYVTARSISAITTYARDAATGELTPVDCILDVAPEGGACASANALAGASSVVLSPDGKQAYVAAQLGSALLTFDRDAASGALTQSACLRNAEPAAGDQVEEDDPESDDPEDDPADDEDFGDEDDPTADDAQADPLSGCGDAKALDGVNELTLSADGRSVFAASSGELTAFDRNPATGRLTQTGCLQEFLTYKSCAPAVGLYGASGLASSGDGRNLYVASRNAQAVGVFGASVAITTRAARVRGRIARVRLACPKARRSGCAGKLRLSNATRTYRLRAGAHRSYAIRVPAAVRRTVRRHRARVTVRATDGRRVTRPSARRVILRR